MAISGILVQIKCLKWFETIHKWLIFKPNYLPQCEKLILSVPLYHGTLSVMGYILLLTNSIISASKTMVFNSSSCPWLIISSV
jgi:hypothetical protein